jgi:AcrR family transcriptional regulator
MTTASTSKRRYHSPLREAQADATKRRVVDAGLELFAQQGYRSTTIAELARAAGVAPETIYGVFGSKQGILEAIAAMVSLERFPSDAWEAEHAARAATPREQLSLIVETIANFYARNPDVIALFGAGGPETAAAFDAWRDARYGPPKQRFEALPPGTLRSDIDAKAASELLSAILAPGVYAQLVDGSGWPLTDYKRRMEDLLRHALLAPGGAG